MLMHLQNINVYVYITQSFMPMGKGCPHLRRYPMSLTESVKNMYLVYLFQRFVRNQ